MKRPWICGWIKARTLTAADIVNHWDETDLANLIYNYGEERLSRRIARKILEQRPFQTTTELAEAISYCVPRKYRYGRIHPATRTFQALRIAVIRNWRFWKLCLQKAPDWLAPGGRLAIISFQQPGRPHGKTFPQGESCPKGHYQETYHRC